MLPNNQCTLVGFQSAEQPRRCLSSRWVSTTPIASMSAKTVVGPTKLNPRRRLVQLKHLRWQWVRWYDGASRLGVAASSERPTRISCAIAALHRQLRGWDASGK